MHKLLYDDMLHHMPSTIKKGGALTGQALIEISLKQTIPNQPAEKLALRSIGT
jgi:hypothetical protein